MRSSDLLQVVLSGLLADLMQVVSSTCIKSANVVDNLQQAVVKYATCSKSVAFLAV
jgi:hypothetical protein